MIPPSPSPSMDGCHDFFVCSSSPPSEAPPPPPKQHHDIDLNLSLGGASPPSSKLPPPDPSRLLGLPSRDQIWQSLQRNGTPPLSQAQDAVWNRRSASVQVLKDSSVDNAVIRRSSSSGAPLQQHHRYAPVLRRQLSDLESLMLSSIHKQQEALEVQKRREIQAQRRGKRRSLMDEKLSKKAKLPSSSSCGYQRICTKLPPAHPLVDDGQIPKPDVDGEILKKGEMFSLLKCDGGSRHGSSEEDSSPCESKGGVKKACHFASDLRESAAANDGVKEANRTSTAAMNNVVRCETNFCDHNRCTDLSLLRQQLHVSSLIKQAAEAGGGGGGDGRSSAAAILTSEALNIDSSGGTHLSHATITRITPRFGAEEDDAGRHRCTTEEARMGVSMERAEGEIMNGDPEKWACTPVLRRATSSTNHLVSGIRRRRGEAEAAQEGSSVGGGGKAASDVRSLKSPRMERQQSWPSAGRWLPGENSRQGEWGERNRGTEGEAEAKGGGGGGAADLVWVTTTGRGPKGKTISGVMYIIGAEAAEEAAVAEGRRRQEVRLICTCHGKHMTPREFVEHSGSSDLSNPERSIVVNPPPSFRQHLLPASTQV